MKPGVHLVNIARGALVDQHALREALDDGRVARAFEWLLAGFLDNLGRFARNEPLAGLVDRAAGY